MDIWCDSAVIGMRSVPSNSPRVSVVVSTNGRCESLANLVACLRHQRFRDFELCIVCGPKNDGTRELTHSWSATGAIKLVDCNEANLARSRNAGLAVAAGDYVAFIDDDALPEPVWLADLVEGIAFGNASGAGGVVFAPDGRSLQFRYSRCNRFGISAHGLDGPADDDAFPLSPNFPHFMGTNFMLRRHVVVAAGGFDEEYQYYLEETDLCCRLVDQGFALRQLNRAPVYHKFLSGTVRDAAGILINHYPTLKSQLYFSLRHARAHASLPEILDVARRFMETYRSTLRDHVAAGRIHGASLDQFDADVERAWQVGLTRGLSSEPQLRPASFYAQPTSFLPFPVVAGTASGKHIVFLIEKPHEASELHRSTSQLAERLAAEGHLVRFMSVANAEEPGKAESVDFEKGVWNHRLATAFLSEPPSPTLVHAKEQFWGRAMAVRAALARIAEFSPIDLIEDRSDSGLSVAVALSGQFTVQLYVGCGDAAARVKEGWPHHPLAVVAQRASGIVSVCGDKHAWNDLPVEVRSRSVQVPTDVAEQVKVYGRRGREHWTARCSAPDR